MFEVGVFADDIDQDLDHALDVVESLGVRWLEIRSAWGKNLVDHTDGDARDIVARIHARGLRVACVAAPLLKSRLDGLGDASHEQFFAETRDTWEQQLAVLRRAAALAHLCGTRLVRCFSFWRAGDDPAPIWERLTARFREIVRAAESEAVVLVMENDFECNLGTGALAARLVRQIGSPHLRVLWDPGNAYFVGETPYPDGYEHVRSLVAHVHLKDAVRSGPGEVPRWVALGTGSVDLLGQVRALLSDGYAGVATMEDHHVPPGGDREAGIRESFRGLRDLLRAATAP